MDAGGLNQLIEYGILGLWTLSLLISNHTMRGNFQSRYDDLNKNVVDVLKKNKETIEENQEKLDKALDKIDETLQTMKQKHLEDKLRAEMRNTQVLEQYYPPTIPLDTYYLFVYNRIMLGENKYKQYKLNLGDLVWNEKKNIYGVVTEVNKFSNKCEITWIGEKKRPKTKHHRWIDPQASRFEKV